jgi:putative transposase
VSGVSPSWLYKWLHGDTSPRRARRERLASEIRRLFAGHRGTYGAARITADLRQSKWRVSENTVATLMRELGLAAGDQQGRTNPVTSSQRARGLPGREEIT